MIKHVVAHLQPIHERRAELERDPGRVDAALEHGNEQARAVAEETMREVREAVGLDQ
jgi:tryptophanyl-tRNA synthetase